MTTLVLCCADLSTSCPFGYSALQDVANFLASQAPAVDPETVKFSTTFPRYVGHIFYILFYWVYLQCREVVGKQYDHCLLQFIDASAWIFLVETFTPSS